MRNTPSFGWCSAFLIALVVAALPTLVYGAQSVVGKTPPSKKVSTQKAAPLRPSVVETQAKKVERILTTGKKLNKSTLKTIVKDAFANTPMDFKDPATQQILTAVVSSIPNAVPSAGAQKAATLIPKEVFLAWVEVVMATRGDRIIKELQRLRSEVVRTGDDSGLENEIALFWKFRPGSDAVDRFDKVWIPVYREVIQRSKKNFEKNIATLLMNPKYLPELIRAFSKDKKKEAVSGAIGSQSSSAGGAGRTSIIFSLPKVYPNMDQNAKCNSDSDCRKNLKCATLSDVLADFFHLPKDTKTCTNIPLSPLPEIRPAEKQGVKGNAIACNSNSDCTPLGDYYGCSSVTGIGSKICTEIKNKPGLKNYSTYDYYLDCAAGTVCYSPNDVCVLLSSETHTSLYPNLPTTFFCYRPATAPSFP